MIYPWQLIFVTPVFIKKQLTKLQLFSFECHFL